MVTRSNGKAGRLSRIWDRVNEPWRWILRAAIPGMAISSVYAVAAHLAYDAGAQGPSPRLRDHRGGHLPGNPRRNPPHHGQLTPKKGAGWS